MPKVRSTAPKSKRASTGQIGGNKKKPKSVSKLTKDLDTVFSRFVRMSRMDSEGIVQCYTCDFKAHYKKIHAGHYISRWYKSTRWHENNVRPQCFMCNIYKKGNNVVYRVNLIKEIGVEAVEEMEKDTIVTWKMGKLDAETLQKQIAIFAEKLKQYERTN